MIWTPEIVDYMKVCCSTGMTIQATAESINQRFKCGATYHAVAGRGRAEKLHWKNKQGRNMKRPVIRVPVKVAPVVVPPSGDYDPSRPLISLGALHHMTCRFPIGDVGEDGFGFCGHLVQQSKIYCPTHYKLAYVPRLAKARAA